MLVLGVICLLTGVGVPIGLGLILAGVGVLGVSAIAANWDFVTDKVGEIWDGVKRYYNTNIKQYLSLTYWKNKAGDIISGLAAGIRNGLSSIKSAISDTISKAWNNAKNFFTGDSSSSAAAASAQASSARIYSANVPALARGAVIPPNREFLAVLGDQTSGTNIEAPLSTIKQAVAEALREHGGGTPSEIRVELLLDGKKLAVNQVKHINAMTEQAGKPVLKF